MHVEFPQRFGPYELLRSLGRGGMAEVFLAQATSNRGETRLVALKRMHAGVSEDHGAVEMLVAEAKLAMRFDHPNIAGVFELGNHRGSYYFLMEYVDGMDVGSLQNICEALRERMDPRAVALICRGIARGLHYAHELHDEDGRKLGIVHRDVSPQNVLVNRRGHIKLIDFGVAKVATRIQQTMAGIIKGKYAYMSPEQASAERVDCRSDVFSLGVCMYELLTGRPLFRGPNMASPFAILRAVREDPIPPAKRVVKGLSPELSRIVGKALTRELGKRYQSAGAFAADLDAWLTAEAKGFEGPELRRYCDDLIDRAPEASVPQRSIATPPVARMTGKDFLPSELSVVARSPLEDDAPTMHPSAVRPKARPPTLHALNQKSPAPSEATIAVPARPPTPAPSSRPMPRAAPPNPATAPHPATIAQPAPPPPSVIASTPPAPAHSWRPTRRTVMQFLWVGLTAFIFALGWSVIATLKKLGKI